jgi:hypothetical protein
MQKWLPQFTDEYCLSLGINCTEKRRSCEAKSHSAGQEIPRPSDYSMSPYGDQRSPPLVSILSQMNPLHTLIHCSFEIYSDTIFHLHLNLCSGLMS